MLPMVLIDPSSTEQDVVNWHLCCHLLTFRSLSADDCTKNDGVLNHLVYQYLDTYILVLL
jgi:hypothetical protein